MKAGSSHSTRSEANRLERHAPAVRGSLSTDMDIGRLAGQTWRHCAPCACSAPTGHARRARRPPVIRWARPDAAAPATARAKRAAAPFNDEPALTMMGFKRGVPVPPTAVPEPSEKMPGMSRANAALYMAAAAGQMPTPPDFSKPSYAPDRKRLAELVAMAEAGDAAGLRAYGIRVSHTGAQELDRFRHDSRHRGQAPAGIGRQAWAKRGRTSHPP